MLFRDAFDPDWRIASLLKFFIEIYLLKILDVFFLFILTFLLQHFVENLVSSIDFHRFASCIFVKISILYSKYFKFNYFFLKKNTNLSAG